MPPSPSSAASVRTAASGAALIPLSGPSDPHYCRMHVSSDFGRKKLSATKLEPKGAQLGAILGNWCMENTLVASRTTQNTDFGANLGLQVSWSAISCAHPHATPRPCPRDKSANAGANGLKLGTEVTLGPSEVRWWLGWVVHGATPPQWRSGGPGGGGVLVWCGW